MHQSKVARDRVHSIGHLADLAVDQVGDEEQVRANWGQLLISSATTPVVGEVVPAGCRLHDAGTHRLRDLPYPERVFEVRQGDAGEEPAPLRSLDCYPNNLPVQPTSFVGRLAELAEIRALLAGARMLTLTGPGWSGKTRLAAQLAAEQNDRWHDGVWWVELGAISDPGLVADLVASAAGVPVEPVQGALRSLSLQLRDRRSLVRMDNCERVLDGAAEVADALTRTCAGVSVLTTSREPLRVAGEVIWTVPTLIEHEAVSLFCERGRQVRPDFGLDAANAPGVRAMCARLDGLPLALELAAAWLRTLTPRQIEAGLDDRGVLGALGRLVDKSLVLVEERDGQARYRLLETIRQYAKSRLDEAGEAPRTRERQLDHYDRTRGHPTRRRGRQQSRDRSAPVHEPSYVKTRLSHVYRRLGVANRTELAALATAHRG